MNRVCRAALLLVVQGCGPSDPPPLAPSPALPGAAPSSTASTASGTGAAPLASGARPAGSGEAPPGGWTSYAAPTKKPKKRGDSFADCTAELREGEWIGDDVAAEEYRQALGEEVDLKSLDRARRGYLKVIQDFPQSPYVILAYLAFGEMFLAADESGSPTLELALQSYQKAAEYPPPTNGALAYIQVRIGEVLFRQGELLKSLGMNQRAVSTVGATASRCGPQIVARAREQTKEACVALSSSSIPQKKALLTRHCAAP